MFHMLKNSIHHIYLEQNDDEVIIEKFNEKQQYIILEQINDLPQSGFTVFNHLYVNPSFEEDFERLFLNRNRHLKSSEGFESLLFLKPQTKHAHYVIVTVWTDETTYQQWQNSKEYKASHHKRGTDSGSDKNIVNRKLSFNISLDLTDS